MAKITADQRRQARNLLRISRYNAGSAKSQLDKTLANYDRADAQNRQLADVEFDKNSKQTASDRFSQAKKLQSSTRGILSSAGNALQGSQLGSLTGMLDSRSDMDSNEALTTLGSNQQTVQNSLDESLNANVLARRDAIAASAKSLRDLEADLAAGLSTINPKLYKKPGKGKANLGSGAVNKKWGQVKNNQAKRVGYFTTDADVRSGY